MTLANRAALLKIALIPLCLAFLLTGFLGLAATIFLLLSFWDIVDGYIAKKYHQVSEFGRQIDPLVDKILAVTVLIGLAGLGKADPVPVMLICGRELAVIGIRSRKVITNTPIVKWKTYLQIGAIVMLLFNLPLANLVLWVAAALSLISGGVYLWRNPLFKQLKLN